jgi:branched-chain amino acid transport system ATP-binding protein
VTAAGAEGTAILELQDLHASIGVSHILQGVTFSVPRNKTTVILGRNGVGKTTTFRAVLGLVKRTGSVVFNGQRIDALTTHDVVRAGIAYVPEDRDIFRGLTVEENLRLAERAGHDHRYDLIHDLFPELKQRAKQMAGTLSGGQQQMVSLGRGLLNDVPLILVDEPTKGLAPRLVLEVMDVLDRVQTLATVLMVEQNLSAARRLAGHVVVISEGRVTYEGSADLLDKDEELRGLLGFTTGVQH